METPNGPAPVPIAKGSSEQLVVVKSPSGTAADHQIACSPTWNVRQLKERLENEYPGSPSARAQRLIHAGKLLDDRQLLSDALRHSTTVHLVVRTPDPDTRRTAGLPRPVQRRPDPAATAESVAAVVAADAPSLSRVPQTAPPAAAAARPTAPTTPAMAAPRSPMSAGHYSQYTQWGYQAQQPPPGYRFAVINGVTYAVPIRTPETPTTASLVQGAAAATGAGNAEGAEPAEAVAAPVAGAAADVAHNNNNNNNNHGAAMAVAREPRESQWRILVKLVLLVWILSPGASAQRLAIMIIGAFVAFLWQTGRLEWTPSPAGAPVERAGGGEGARRGEEEGGGEGEGSDAEYVTTDDEQGAEEGAAAEAATSVRRRRRRTAEGEREGEGRPVGAAATALAWYVSLIDMLHLFVVSLLPTRPAHA